MIRAHSRALALPDTLPHIPANGSRAEWTALSTVFFSLEPPETYDSVLVVIRHKVSHLLVIAFNHPESLFSSQLSLQDEDSGFRLRHVHNRL